MDFMEELYTTNFALYLEHFEEFSKDNKVELFEKQYEKFIKYYENVTKDLFKKNKKKTLEQIAGQIFDNDKKFYVAEEEVGCEKKEKIKNYLRYQILAGQMTIDKYYKDILKDFNKGYFEGDLIEGKVSFLKEMVIDFYELISAYEVNVLENKSLNGVKSILAPDGKKLFNISRQMKVQQICKGDSEVTAISIFTIRQAIEVTLKNALKIKYIIKDGEIFKQLNGDSLIAFMKNNDNIEMDLDSSLLKKIFSWTNWYIHSGALMYHWEIDVAHDLLKKIFYSSHGIENNEIGIKILKSYYQDNSLIEKDLLKYYEIHNGRVIFNNNSDVQIVESFARSKLDK